MKYPKLAIALSFGMLGATPALSFDPHNEVSKFFDSMMGDRTAVTREHDLMIANSQCIAGCALERAMCIHSSLHVPPRDYIRGRSAKCMIVGGMCMDRCDDALSTGMAALASGLAIMR